MAVGDVEAVPVEAVRRVVHRRAERPLHRRRHRRHRQALLLRELGARREPADERQPRVRSHCRFRNRGTEYVSGSCIKWIGGGAKRQCDRALRQPHELVVAPEERRLARRRLRRRAAHLGVDGKVILPPPCIFCMENH